jgi:hypothetical protein
LRRPTASISSGGSGRRGSERDIERYADRGRLRVGGRSPMSPPSSLPLPPSSRSSTPSSRRTPLPAAHANTYASTLFSQTSFVTALELEDYEPTSPSDMRTESTYSSTYGSGSAGGLNSATPLFNLKDYKNPNGPGFGTPTSTTGSPTIQYPPAAISPGGVVRTDTGTTNQVLVEEIVRLRERLALAEAAAGGGNGNGEGGRGGTGRNSSDGEAPPIYSV